MLTELFQAVEVRIKTSNAALKTGRYKGELEEGKDWTPDFPAVFIRLNRYRPATRNSKGEFTKQYAEFTLYIADRNVENPTVLNTLESIMNLFNGVDINFMIGSGDEAQKEFMKIEIEDGGADLYAYGHQVEIYTLIIKIY